MEGGTAEGFWRARAEQLQHALSSRIAVEQAKGILAERLGLEMDGAFEVLRYAARSTHAKLHELAAAVVASEETPPAIVQAVARHASLLSRGPRPERLIQTERFFRAINAEILRQDSGQTDYICECGNPLCTQSIAVDSAVLLRLHAEPNLFVVLPGHEIPDVETVVERSEDFLIVRKTGD
jgi:predicted aconitase